MRCILIGILFVIGIVGLAGCDAPAWEEQIGSTPSMETTEATTNGESPDWDWNWD